MDTEQNEYNEMTTWHDNGHERSNKIMDNTTKSSNHDGDRIPVSRQGEGQGGALPGSGPLGKSPGGESPDHANPESACPAGVEIQGSATAMIEEEIVKSEVDLTSEWRSVRTEFGIGVASTPVVELERVDTVGDHGERAEIPRIIDVERIDPEVTKYLTRKRSRMQSTNVEEVTTDASGGSSDRQTRKRGRKKKRKRGIQHQRE